MNDVRHYSEVAKYQGRPALIRISVHPNGTKKVVGVEYLDSTTGALADALRPRVAQPVKDDHKSPAPGVGLGLAVMLVILGGALSWFSPPLSGGTILGALLVAVGVAGVFRILHVETKRGAK